MAKTAARSMERKSQCGDFEFLAVKLFAQSKSSTNRQSAGTESDSGEPSLGANPKKVDGNSRRQGVWKRRRVASLGSASSDQV